MADRRVTERVAAERREAERREADRRVMLAPPSALGLLIGALFLLASLTPSMIPRAAMIQGALGGVCFAAGYGIGAGLVALWWFMGLPVAETLQARRRASRLGMAAAAVVLAVAAVSMTGWQNAVRAAMDLPPVLTIHPVTVFALAAVVALVLIMLGRLFYLIARRIAHWLDRFMPPRVSRTVALIVAAALFWSVGNGVILKNALSGFDASYRRVDGLLDPDAPPPADPLKTGSAASLIPWDSLGNEGRNMVAGHPDAAAIEAVSRAPAKEPLRIYAGLNSAETPEERADLALQEMLRVGAFGRANLIVATPTGTGWIDPAGLAPAEFLLHGDVATVAVQYSYLPSWLTLMVDTGYGAETARAVFQAVYGHWRTLPRDARPRLFLFGLSLGSVNGDAAVDLYDVIGDPFDGALWAGPPFANRTWRNLVSERQPDTPVWLPRFRDGSVVRFAAEGRPLENPQSGWSPMRIVYLQYSSDPIVYFTERSGVAVPPALRAPLGPQVSPELRWIPVVTMLQLAFDMMTATTVPLGRGHVYSAADYTDGWAAVLAPQGWDPPALTRLKDHLAGRGL